VCSVGALVGRCDARPITLEHGSSCPPVKRSFSAGTTRTANVGLACCKEAALLAVVVDSASLLVSNGHRCRGWRSELVQDVDQLSVRWRSPFAEGLHRIRLGQAVEPREQANALTAGKLGL
jgi:hypothetical protein